MAIDVNICQPEKNIRIGSIDVNEKLLGTEWIRSNKQHVLSCYQKSVITSLVG
jgi:hypothetical protein